MENGAIPDGNIFAASSKNNGLTGPSRGRLNLQEQESKSGGWVAGASNTNQWLSVKFDKDYTIITGTGTSRITTY